MSGRMVRAPTARSARASPGLPSGGGSGSGGAPPKGLAEHRLSLFQSWGDALELTELTQSVDPEPMEQDHGGAVSFVVVGDACSVKGRECVHMVSQTLVLDLVRDLNSVAELGGDKIRPRPRVGASRGLSAGVRFSRRSQSAP